MPKRLNVTKFKMGNTKGSFTDTLGRRLDAVQLDGRDVEAAWAALRQTTYDTAMECLGPVTRKHRDWFDENSTEIIQLLDDKRQAYQVYIDDPNNAAKKATLRNIRSTVQAKLRNIQDTWLSNKADEIQGFADRKDMKNFYDGLKEIYGPTTSGSFSLLSADGSTLILDKEKILERWVEHFDSVLNRPSSINDEAIDRLPQIPLSEALDEVPTLDGTRKAILRLANGKAPGADSIPAEVYKEGGPALTEKIHQLFVLIWEHETVLQDFKDASIVHLYKRKGNRQSCDDHRGSSLHCRQGLGQSSTQPSH